MTKLIKISFLMSFLFLLVNCDKPSVTKSGIKIKIGVIAPITGSNSAIGKNGFNGIKLGKELYSTLDNGDEVVLVTRDDKSDQNKTLKALDYLVNHEKVSAVLLLSASDSAIAVSKVANKYKTPILATVATNPQTTKHSQYVSQLAFSDATQALVAALYIRDELFIKKVAVFNNPESAYSSYLANTFINKYHSLGGVVTNFININPVGPIDYVKLVKQAQENKPSLIYMPVNAHAVLAIAKEAKNQDWAPKAFVTDGLLSTVIEEHEGDLELIDGMLATEMYADNMLLSNFGKKVFRLIEKKGQDVTTHLLNGIEGYGVLFTAINQCEAPYSHQCINRSIRSNKSFSGISGKVTIDENGRADHTLFINTIKNGEMKIVVKVN